MQSICRMAAGLSLSFQSSPSPEAGCNHAMETQNRFVQNVSILTQPGGRVQYGEFIHCFKVQMFQSSPSPEAGCNHMPHFSAVRKFVFQSSPSPEAGCNRARVGNVIDVLSFNPHPARRPGAIPLAPIRWAYSPGFNPHPARRPGAINRFGLLSRSAVVVSILTQPGGRVQCSSGCPLYRGDAVSILTQPGGRVQSTARS